MTYVDELLDLVYKDKKKSNTYDRYPVRFLFSRLDENTFTDIKEFYAKYNSKRVEKEYCFLQELEYIRLADLLTYPDAWITRNKLYNYISKLNPEKDYLVLGFSELARFYSKTDLQSLIISFMTDIESVARANKQRIYFLCFSLLDKLEEVLKINGRNSSINPILCREDFKNADSICVYYANSRFNKSLFKNVIVNSCEWLSLYNLKNIDHSQGIVCLSDTLALIYEKAKPDNFVEIYKIDSYYSLLVKMYHLNIEKCEENLFKQDFWLKLYESFILNNCTSLKYLILKSLKVQSIDVDNFISLFMNSDLFQKQLLTLYIIEFEEEFKYATYLKKALLNSVKFDFNTFQQEIVCSFDIHTNDYELEARKFYINILMNEKYIDCDFQTDNLLRSINRTFYSYLLSKIFNSKLEEEDLSSLTMELFKEKYSVSKEYFEEVFKTYYNLYLSKIITGNFVIEHYIVMNLVSNSLITVSEATSLYPDLKKYLGNRINPFISSKEQEISEYIYEYKLSKIMSLATKKFVTLSYKNSEENMLRWYLNHDICHQQDNINKNRFDKLIVFDGVGIEYFDYIISVLIEEGKYINYADFCKCYLPSITSINKASIIKPDKWITDFDSQRIHGAVYNNKKTLPDSLKLLRKMLHNLISDYPNVKICLTADHGATCQSKLIPASKKYNFDKSDHEGRCMEVYDPLYYKSNEDYALYNDMKAQKNYLVSLKNISLNENPIRECHGGATIEECFVPCIVFSSNKEIKNFTIKTIKNSVNGLNKNILIEIIPMPDTIPVLIEENGNQSNFTYDKNNLWQASIKEVTTQDIVIKINSFETKMRVISSSGISKKGDDGFDD